MAVSQPGAPAAPRAAGNGATSVGPDSRRPAARDRRPLHRHRARRSRHSARRRIRLAGRHRGDARADAFGARASSEGSASDRLGVMAKRARLLLALHVPWWGVLLLGIACVGLGGVLTADPSLSLSALDRLVAAALILTGLTDLAF